MSETTLPIKDGAYKTRQRRVLDDGPRGITPYSAEHPDQRAELIAALAPLAKLIGAPASDGKLEAVRALLAGTLSMGLPDGAANAARQDLQLALLAGTSGLGQSGKAPVSLTRTEVGVSPAFIPIAGRAMNLLCSGGAGVQAQLERSFDGGATWYVKINDALRAVTPETFTDTETEVGVQYRWNLIAITGGTVTFRISQ